MVGQRRRECRAIDWPREQVAHPAQAFAQVTGVEPEAMHRERDFDADARFTGAQRELDRGADIVDVRADHLDELRSWQIQRFPRRRSNQVQVVGRVAATHWYVL